MATKDVILTLFLMLGAGLAAELAAGLLRVPKMLILLAAGALLGPAVAGAIDVPLDSTGVQVLLTLGVSIILFHGGLQLHAHVLKPVAFGLGMLVLPGMILTAVVTGLVASAVFGLPFWSGLLIGAVLAATDPAILIPLFERMHIRPKISQTIVAESALNDPTGAVLALAVAGVVLSGHVSLTHTLWSFVEDLGISTGLGIVFGLLSAVAVSKRWAGVWGEPVSIVVMAVGVGGYFSIDFAGGSGYLGAFIAGLIVGNMDLFRLAMDQENERDLRTFVGIGSDVVVMLVFISLGANLPWSDMRDHFLPALAVVATLLLVARPLAIAACLLPDRRGRWSREELLFMAWTRETGVVPAALAGIVVAMGVPDASLVVTTVAIAIVVTLTLQSTTKPWLARRLGLIETDVAPSEAGAAPPETAPAGDASLAFPNPGVALE